MMGIARQMQAKPVIIEGVLTYQTTRWAPQTSLVPAPHLVNDGKANIVANEPAEVNARRQAMLAYLRPTFR